ncbi:MAG: sulfurtransferase TusA family protein [Pseudomonadota bacterium]
MTDAPDHHAELDARGLLCPLPVLKTRKRLQALALGEILRVEADDPATLVDIPHFCSEQGHELVASGTAGAGALLFWVRRGT